jgi:protein-tyrosine-phosphatase
MAQDHLIVFVCEHGAAKSILAAAYFNKFAMERNLHFHAIARGTNPDLELSPKTMEGLHQDGLAPAESVPQKLTLADLETAEQIISFCELPEEYGKRALHENWNDIPSVSEDYEKARDMIIAKIKAMMK